MRACVHMCTCVGRSGIQFVHAPYSVGLCLATSLLVGGLVETPYSTTKNWTTSGAGWLGLHWIFQPELQEHTPRTTFVLKSCDFSSRSCRGPGGNRTRVRLYLKAAELPRSRGIRARDCGIAKAGAQTTRQLLKAVSRARQLHGATARAL